MNIVEFVKMVRKMRSAQRSYFKTRLQSDLVAAKQLEATVDKALADGVILRVQESLDLSGSQRPTDDQQTPPLPLPDERGGDKENGEQ